MQRPYKFSRHQMYMKIEKFFNTPRLGTALFLGEGKISKIQHMFPKETKRITTDYPEVDIMNLHQYEDESMDFVVADQVLEHVRKPWEAMEEVRRVLKPGGYAIMTTCLMMHLHAVPYDYFRFTPDGLKVLCENFSSIEQCDGMGNFKLVEMCEKGYRGKPVQPNTDLEKYANGNDGKNYLHVWIIAQK